MATTAIRSLGTLLPLYCVLMQFAFFTEAQISNFDGCPGGVLTVPEDYPIGDVLFELQAEVRGVYPTVNVTMRTNNNVAADLVSVGPAVFVGNSTPAVSDWASNVTLEKQLDRDFEPSSRTLSFRAEDSAKNQAYHICTILITDVNDNSPKFEGVPYDLHVPENTTVGEILLEGISASDPDTGAGGQVSLYSQFPDESVAAVFNTTTRVAGNGQVMGVSLAQPLDYETRFFYSFNIMAVDGGNLSSTETVTVTVIDVQDTPPFFVLSTYRAAIREHAPVGTSIIKVSAEDGDLGHPNGIVYSIVRGRTDYFSIDNDTGVITSLVELDRDNVTMVGPEAVFELIVQAQETDDVLPQYGNTTANVSVVVVVEDINDNAPTFDRSEPYTAFVREDTPDGTLIYFDGDGYISVSDADQGSNARFNLTVERGGVPWPMVEATPSAVYSEALVLLRAVGTDVFVDLASTHITLQVVAREVSTPERRSSTAEVVITVEEMEEPPPTPAPVTDDGITAPDVVVFIIGFLVVFNIVASVLIIWFVRKRSKRDKARPPVLGRRGSKYYVNGLEKEDKRSLGLQNGGNAVLGADSVLVEVEGKDRCDVVPISAVISQQSTTSSSSSSSSSTANHDRKSVSYDGEEGHKTDRKVLLANEVSPAKSGSNGSVIATTADINDPATATTTAAADLPKFSMAKRNVSSPHNPALSFLNPVSEPSSSASTFQLATTAFPTTTTTCSTTANGISHSSAPMSTPVVAGLQSVEQVTRFSAGGTVSTTVAPVQDNSQSPSSPSGAAPSGDTESGNAGASSAPRSASEILY